MEGHYSFCEWVALHFKVYSFVTEQIVYMPWLVWRVPLWAHACTGLFGTLTLFLQTYNYQGLCWIIRQLFSFYKCIHCFLCLIARRMGRGIDATDHMWSQNTMIIKLHNSVKPALYLHLCLCPKDWVQQARTVQQAPLPDDLQCLVLVFEETHIV